jgi:hypothetical protein
LLELGKRSRPRRWRPFAASPGSPARRAYHILRRPGTTG